MRTSPRRTAALVVALTAALGCARGTRPPCENPPPFYVLLEGGGRLNPSAAGHPLTTQVLVLQLQSTARLDAAEFTEVWQRAKDVLGDDLLALNELTLDPGARVMRGFVRDPKATQVAVAGVFRQPTGTSWRAAVPLPAPEPERCTPEPAAVSEAPGAGSHVLPFVLQDYRVEPQRAHLAPEPER